MPARPSTPVDVLLPVRLPAPWLDDCLAGLRDQTTQNWHLVCVVHGEPGDVAERVYSVDPTAAILMMPSEKSLVDVLNAGLDHCSAPYIARLDADDIPEPERIEMQARWLDERTDVGLVCSPVIWIGEGGEVRKTDPLDGRPLINGLRWKNVIAHPSVMFRRQAVIDLGGYNHHATHAEDYELWLRIAAAWRIARIPHLLLRYRVHGDQVSRTNVIPPASRRAVAQARLRLAQSRHESKAAAHIRQAVWALSQVIRDLVRV